MEAILNALTEHPYKALLVLTIMANIAQWRHMVRLVRMMAHERKAHAEFLEHAAEQLLNERLNGEHGS